VYNLYNLEDVQERGLTLFWAHDPGQPAPFEICLDGRLDDILQALYALGWCFSASATLSFQKG
jgi:hypothetical protein